MIPSNIVKTAFSGYPLFEFKEGVDFSVLFALRESRRTSDPVLSRDRGSPIQLHP
jgi:hypothetical protein